MIAFDDFVYTTSQQESDTIDLGRWSTVTITGRHDILTSIFTCYCPVRSTSLGLAYPQHLLYISKNRNSLPDINCPRQLFGIDLKNAFGA